MTTLTPELVNRYIASAQPFVESKTDRLALQRAIELNAPPKLRQGNPRGKYIGDMYFAAYVHKAAVKVESLQTAIWAEIHAALWAGRLHPQLDCLDQARVPSRDNEDHSTSYNNLVHHRLVT